MSPRKPRPWYADGLRFQCQRCGACCTGQPGYIFVTPGEIAGLSRALGMDLDAFSRHHVSRVGRAYTIRQRVDHDCMLLDELTGACRGHAQRPAQCRAWPFWAENLASPQDWQLAAVECPGIGEGPLHQDIRSHRPGSEL